MGGTVFYFFKVKNFFKQFFTTLRSYFTFPFKKSLYKFCHPSFFFSCSSFPCRPHCLGLWTSLYLSSLLIHTDPEACCKNTLWMPKYVTTAVYKENIIYCSQIFCFFLLNLCSFFFKLYCMIHEVSFANHYELTWGSRKLLPTWLAHILHLCSCQFQPTHRLVNLALQDLQLHWNVILFFLQISSGM